MRSELLILLAFAAAGISEGDNSWDPKPTHLKQLAHSKSGHRYSNGSALKGDAEDGGGCEDEEECTACEIPFDSKAVIGPCFRPEIVCPAPFAQWCINDNNNNFQHMVSCLDFQTRAVKFVFHRIIGADLPGERLNPCPPFRTVADFYMDITATTCYGMAESFDAVAQLLNSEALAGEYIQPGRQLYFARGHHMASADGGSALQKSDTWYYINASPQWQSINNGNWKIMEGRIRNLAADGGAEYDIYSGSYGQLNLPLNDGTMIPIWIGRRGQVLTREHIPVPRFTWKVIHNPAKRTAVAMVAINVPFEQLVTDDDRTLCADVCHLLPWVDPNWKLSYERGYIICCRVQDFRARVPYAPNLGNLDLFVG